MADAKANIELTLKNVRLSFCKVYRGQPRLQDTTKKIVGWNFSTNLLIDKTNDPVQVKMIKDAMIAVREAKWPGQKKTFAADKKCLRDGDVKDEDTGEISQAFEHSKGMMYLSANRPVEIDENGKPVDNPLLNSIIDSRKGPDGKFPRLKERDGKIYSGAYVNAIVRIYAFDGKANGYPDRINCSLEGLQFLRHGERFGAGAIDADSKFQDEGPEPDDDMAPSSKSKRDPLDDDI
jgi:hypothetical protein